MIKRTASNGSAEGSSRGFLSSIGLGISGRRSMTNNSASTAASGNGNDTTIFQQQEAEGEDGADVPMKSQDFAYYFKSSDQVMKKLETSKPIRNSKAPTKKNEKDKAKTDVASTTSSQTATQSTDEDGSGFMFRWQRDKKGGAGDTNDKGNGSYADMDDDDDNNVNGEDTILSSPSSNALSAASASASGITRAMAITGNVPGTQLSIAAFLGKQTASAKLIPPRVLNQALYSSASSSGKAYIATPQQFVISLATAGAPTNKDGSSELHSKASKLNLVSGETTGEILKDGLEVDDFSRLDGNEEEDVANNTELESCVNSLRLVSNWPPEAPKFQPPSPETDIPIVENYKRRLPSTRDKGPMAKTRLGSTIDGRPSLIKSNAAQSSRKLSLADQDQSKMQEKSKAASGWRRPSFMPGGRKSLIPNQSLGPTFYVKRPLMLVVPPPPDPPRPPRGGSSEERKQMEKEIQIMFFEDMFSNLLGMKLEKAELEHKNAELAKIIEETDQAIASLVDSQQESGMTSINEKDEKTEANPGHGRTISLSEAYSGGAARPLSTKFSRPSMEVAT